ncbi:MAG TPA: biotin--[acetyl-CoA-carboxylase] ligase [Legionella sp.]|nr:biotin--[acetyl-CoA-carboxylase] ligase [Legionella sp.]
MLIPLNETTIQHHLTANACTLPIHFHLLATVDSTNRFIKERVGTKAIEVCCAETQTQGRGRFGRHWHSPFGENIYLSIRQQINADITQLSGFSLVVSMAIWAALRPISSEHQVLIKWPNDLLWQNRKLSGNLIEVISTHPGGPTDVVIGVGLNVNEAAHDEPMIDKPWCSLFDITAQRYDRNIVIAQLIIEIEQHIEQLINHGFVSFHPAWQAMDYLHHQYITVSQATGTFSGLAQGVDGSGRLILVDDANATHYLASGDTSITGAG